MVIKMHPKLGGRMHKHSEKFNNERKYKKVPNRRHGARSAITELKDTLEGFSSRLSEVEEWVSELEDREVELNETEQQKEKNNFKKWQ